MSRPFQLMCRPAAMKNAVALISIVTALTLPTSAWLGPNEVLAPLGAGGMGEVYKGRDTHLDRIALKICMRCRATAKRFLLADSRTDAVPPVHVVLHWASRLQR